MKTFKEKGRRISSVLLTLLLCVAMLPAGVFADNEGDAQGSGDVTVEELNLETVDGAAGDLSETDQELPLADPAEEPAECTHASLKMIPADKASCNKEGVVEHYQCTECGKKFLDAEGKQEVTDDSQIIIPADPEAHVWSDWEVTKTASPEGDGEEARTCAVCGETETRTYEYLDEIVAPEDLSKKNETFKLDGISVQFKDPVCKDPDDLLNSSKTGRVWIKGLKSSMKVSWENPGDVSIMDGVIILRSTGSSSVFKEVKRVPFKTFVNGEATVKPKTTYTDTTAKSNNTTYKYRLVSYIELDDITYISHLSKNDWAAGRTSGSKLKNAYTGTINKKTAKLQSKESVTLKVTLSSSKTKFMPTSRRWSSSDKSVATVTTKGKVNAKAPGTATISCRLASGAVVKSKVTVVGALKPGKPTIKVDYATTSSITLIWKKVKNATSYDVYKSNDGLHWDKTPKNTKNTTYKFDGLTKNHRYTFYVIARNDHKGVDKDGKSKTYTSLGDNSNVLNQKAVVKRRPMTLTGFPKKKSQKTGTTLKVTVKVNPPLARKAQLQMKSGKKWVNKKTIKLPKGSSQKSVDITFPNSWWSKTTEWRLVIPPTVTTDGFTTDTLKITSTRYYQNPSSYVQIRDSISKHGYSHYVSPVLVNGSSTKSAHIEALIKTARKYMGDRYVQSRSGAPGKGIDESGLVIQACYGAGVDLWPISPSTRPYNCVPKIMNAKLRKIPYKGLVEGTTNNYRDVNRGDLIFFAKSKNGTPIHVAIYTGLGGIIHADPDKGKVCTSTIGALEGAGYVVVGVRRIFN